MENLTKGHCYMLLDLDSLIETFIPTSDLQFLLLLIHIKSFQSSLIPKLQENIESKVLILPKVWNQNNRILMFSWLLKMLINKWWLKKRIKLLSFLENLEQVRQNLLRLFFAILHKLLQGLKVQILISWISQKTLKLVVEVLWKVSKSKFLKQIQFSKLLVMQKLSKTPTLLDLVNLLKSISMIRVKLCSLKFHTTFWKNQES